MGVPILLPRLGFSMSEGRLSEWLVADGSAVIQGQPIYSLESEKTIQDVEAPATGTLKIHKVPGTSFAVGTLLGEIV